tara:strand:- start:97 stop:711 length:615 start_codon:yes stop_codon:yes gene_type:complete
MIFKIIKIIILLNLFLINLSFSKNLLIDQNLKNLDGTYNAVIEIPAGSSIKYELNKNGDEISEQIENGKIRLINYLPYPFNYGFIPQTVLPSENGGDGDALDVIVLGPRVQKGTILKIKPLGTLISFDNNETDSKVIAVSLNETGLSNINNIRELEENYIGILDIIKTWIINYKGVSIELKRVLNKSGTIDIIESYHQAYLKEK